MADGIHDETAYENLSLTKLQCEPADIPQHLYRVQYSSCRTTLTATGLHASETASIPAHDIAAFRQSLQNFSTWNHNHKTPFVALFSQREAAELFALNKSADITLITIATSRLLAANVQLFNLHRLLATLAIQAVGTAQRSEGVFLCLHHIPSSSILETKSRDQVELGHFIEQYWSHRTQGYEEQKWTPPRMMLERSASVSSSARSVADGRPSLRHRLSVRKGMGQRLGSKLNLNLNLNLNLGKVEGEVGVSRAEAVDSRCMVSPGGCREAHYVQ